MSLLKLKNIDGKGRGVIARCDVAADTILETAPVVSVNVSFQGYENWMCENGVSTLPTPLDQYAFYWTKDKEAVCFSLLSFVNHSSNPTARISRDYENNTISLIAKVDLKEGQEITIDYDYSPLGFEVKE